MHEQQPEFKERGLSRRQLIGAGLGSLVLGLPKSVSAPERYPGKPDAEYVSQAEIDELKANLYTTADTYSLSLVPENDIHVTYELLREAETEAEAISIISTFTEHQFGFPVNYTATRHDDSEAGLRMERLVGYLSLLPKELYEAIDLAKIDIGPPPPFLQAPAGGMFVASFTTYESVNTITLTPLYSPLQSNAPHVLLHEASHGLDYMSLLGDGDEKSRRAADQHLNMGDESEYIADKAAEWMMGQVQRGAESSEWLNDLVERFDSLMPGLAPYVEEALQPYVLAFTKSERDYAFFQPRQ